jgi:hypothetical protein
MAKTEGPGFWLEVGGVGGTGVLRLGAGADRVDAAVPFRNRADIRRLVERIHCLYGH